MDGGGLLAAMGLDSLAMPFVVRIWIAFLACLVIGVAVSLVTAPPREDRPVQLSGVRFAAKPVFNPASLWRLSPF